MKKEEKRYGLLKGILLFVLVAVILTWLIPIGQFNGSDFQTDNSLARIGLTDLSWLVYYGFEFALDKIVMLLAIGGFYGVLSKTKAYDNLTSAIANKINNKKIAVVIFSVIIAALTSVLTQTFVVLIFVPFIISIMNKMKLDKTTIFATSFGSILVGILGATYGTEGLILLISRYFTGENFDPNKTVLIRAGVLLIGLVLFNFFTISHMNKKEKDNETTDMFPIAVENDKKKSSIPIIIVGVLLFVIVILGFVNWSTFGIAVFDNFHKSLMDMKWGDFYVFKSILGSNLSAFGSWDLFHISSVLFIATIILGLCYSKFNEFVHNFADGAKKMIKPCMVLMGAFTVMTVLYMSPFTATISNKILSLTDGFNVATTSLSLFVCNLFHANLDFTGYILGTHLATEYVDFMNPIYVIISTLYGFVAFFAPTSIVLGVGLTSLDVKYKEWLKYIWKFLIGMIICLLVIFLLMTII